jgi:hypothetical protein
MRRSREPQKVRLGEAFAPESRAVVTRIVLLDYDDINR